MSNLNDLIGQDFEIQGVRFHGTEECRPCYWMDQAIAPGTEEFLKGRGGLRARMLTSGKLHSSANGHPERSEGPHLRRLRYAMERARSISLCALPRFARNDGLKNERDEHQRSVARRRPIASNGPR